MQDSSDTRALMAMIEGFRVTQAIHAAVTLGVPAALANGPRACDDIAAEVGAHAPTLYRLLRALAAAGVLREGAGRVFSLTELGDALRPDHPQSLAGWAAFVGRPYYWQAWSNLTHSVRTGENAFRALNGESIWEYRERNAEESEVFDAAMTALSRLATPAIVAAYDFGQFRRIVDVGGGRGALLAAILAAHPASSGVLFDQPHVVSGAAELLAAAGVADRVEIAGGDMFTAVPEGGDAYVMKFIIHDWEDEDCLRVLACVRAAMKPDGRLLIIERVVGAPNEDAASKFPDLNMLVAPGGLERTADEFASLLERGGFRMLGITRTRSPSCVIEAAGA